MERTKTIKIKPVTYIDQDSISDPNADIIRELDTLGLNPPDKCRKCEKLAVCGLLVAIEILMHE